MSDCIAFACSAIEHLLYGKNCCYGYDWNGQHDEGHRRILYGIDFNRASENRLVQSAQQMVKKPMRYLALDESIFGIIELLQVQKTLAFNDMPMYLQDVFGNLLPWGHRVALNPGKGVKKDEKRHKKRPRRTNR